MSTLIDLRSDTVTKPAEGMRAAMARADVGDDVYGEDPSIRKLEERAAELSGKEAALFVPTGTMANQVAIGVHTTHGDEVIAGDGSHSFLYEGGGGPRLNGVQFQIVGKGGSFSAEDVRAAYKEDNHHHAPTTLLALENTHNRGGGFVWKLEDVKSVTSAARELKMKTHLDGARIFNAQVKSGVPVKEWSASFDTVSFCFSKGLGAPVGSILCGTKAAMHKAHRLRKLFGGGMRQAGILGAAALYALDHNVERLAEDHANAALLAERLADVKGIVVDPKSVQTNILIFDLAVGAPDARSFVARAKECGVLLNAVSARSVRAVTHLDVSRAGIEEAVTRLREVMS